jgi:hypothetical protein
MSKQKVFEIVFSVRILWGMEADGSKELKTITYPYEGNLRGAKLRATKICMEKYFFACRRGDAKVQILHNNERIASKTFDHGQPWFTAHWRVRALDL